MMMLWMLILKKSKMMPKSKHAIRFKKKNWVKPVGIANEKYICNTIYLTGDTRPTSNPKPFP
jgi:hypothetical protein